MRLEDRPKFWARGGRPAGGVGFSRWLLRPGHRSRRRVPLARPNACCECLYGYPAGFNQGPPRPPPARFPCKFASRPLVSPVVLWTPCCSRTPPPQRMLRHWGAGAAQGREALRGVSGGWVGYCIKGDMDSESLVLLHSTLFAMIYPTKDAKPWSRKTGIQPRRFWWGRGAARGRLRMPAISCRRCRPSEQPRAAVHSSKRCPLRAGRAPSLALAYPRPGAVAHRSSQSCRQGCRSRGIVTTLMTTATAPGRG